LASRLEQFTPIPPIATEFLQRIAEACTSTREKWLVSLTGSPAGPKAQTVDFTRTGKKYHRDGCRYPHPVVWEFRKPGSVSMICAVHSRSCIT